MSGARVRDRRRKPSEAQLAGFDTALERAAKPRLELVQALRALAQLHARIAALQAVRDSREVAPLFCEVLARAERDALLEVRHPLQPLALIRDRELGRLGRRRRAQ